MRLRCGLVRASNRWNMVPQLSSRQSPSSCPCPLLSAFLKHHLTSSPPRFIGRGPSWRSLSSNTPLPNNEKDRNTQDKESDVKEDPLKLFFQRKAAFEKEQSLESTTKATTTTTTSNANDATGVQRKYPERNQEVDRHRHGNSNMNFGHNDKLSRNNWQNRNHNNRNRNTDENRLSPRESNYRQQQSWRRDGGRPSALTSRNDKTVSSDDNHVRNRSRGDSSTHFGRQYYDNRNVARSDLDDDNNNNKKKQYTGTVEGTSKLTELIRQMQRNAHLNPTPKVSSPNPHSPRSFSRQDRQRSNGGAAPRPSWRRDSFQQRIDRNDEGGGPSSNRFQSPQPRSSRWSPPQVSEEFLFGRLSRTEDSIEDGSAPSPEETAVRTVNLPATSLTVTEASLLFRVKVDDIHDKLRAMGEAPGPYDMKEFLLDVDTLELLGLEYGIETVRSTTEAISADADQLLMQQRRSDADLQSESLMVDGAAMPSLPPRPPVVSVMGHVDHGKTTLMDALRRRSLEQEQGGKKKSKVEKARKNKKNAAAGGLQTNDVAGTEAGGITQVISAFQVAVDGYDDKITFLDTPGHAAFRSMRQSGSHAADVIVLVIAADDGVSPQTIEILDMYKSIVKGSSDGGISMVVALNKIDKPGVDVDEAKMRIENQLLEHGIIAEGMNATDSEFGQPVQVIPTSGLTGVGLDDLMEGLMLQSEVMDLRADDEAHAEGIVMDARIEKGLGVVADCIIRWGKIESGSIVMSGDQVAKVRMLKNVNNKMVKKGLPSQPVRIVGFKSMPKAGDPLVVVESEEVAEEIMERRLALNASVLPAGDRPDADPSDLSLQIHGMRRGDSWRVRKVHERAGIEDADGSTRIPIIVKADADGSLSAVRDSLVNLADESTLGVVIDPISEGIGEITSSDIQMAKESEATIFAFGLSKRIDQATLNLAESEGVTICNNDIIYALLDEAKEVLGKHLPPTPHEHIHGRALVQAVFTIDTSDGKEQVAGLRVTNGSIYKDRAKSGGAAASSSTETPPLDCGFRVLRNGKQIAPDPTDASDNQQSPAITASSLRKFKELVDNVRMGEECGLALNGFSAFQEGDEIECYSVEMKTTRL